MIRQLNSFFLTFSKIIITLHMIVSDLVKVNEKSPLFPKNQRKFHNLAQSYKKTMKFVTANNNTQNIRKDILVCDKLLRDLQTWKSIGLMLLVIYDNVIKSSWSRSICWCDSVEIKFELFFEICDIILYSSANLPKFLFIIMR